MSDRSGPIVVGLGEVLWDEFEDQRRPGGAPANVAFQANQLGNSGIVASRVGTDEAGDQILELLGERGLYTGWIQRDEDHPTGRVTVQAGPDGGPDYVIHEDVAWDFLSFEDDLAELCRSADAICFGTLAQRCRTSRETIHRCLYVARPECLVVYDANVRQEWYTRDWIERSLRSADVLKLNAVEVETLARLLGLSSAEHLEFAEAIRKRYDVSLVCVTRGANGCLLASNAETVDLPGKPVEVADTVGAGDAFTAGLITGRLKGWPLTACAAFANDAGALVASRYGAMPVLTDEFARLIEEYSAA